MLRISKLMDYGTVVLTYMAGAPTQVRSASELAEALKLGQATVSKILKTLGQHNIVVSQRGAHGGYRLARPASEITVAQVLDALDDQPFGLTECTANPGACAVEADCQIRTNGERINDMVRQTLESVTIADMHGTVAYPLTYHTTISQPVKAASTQTAASDMELL